MDDQAPDEDAFKIDFRYPVVWQIFGTEYVSLYLRVISFLLVDLFIAGDVPSNSAFQL